MFGEYATIFTLARTLLSKDEQPAHDKSTESA